MPVQRCQREGSKGWKWGQAGHCFLGPDAKQKAAFVGRQARGDAVSVRAPRIPRMLEERRRRDLLRRVRLMQGVLMNQLGPELRRLTPDINERSRQDSLSSIADALSLVNIVRAVERAWRVVFGPNTQDLQAFAAEVDGFSTRQNSRLLARVANIKVSQIPKTNSVGILSKWASANASLITSLDSRHFNDVAKAIEDAVVGGKSTATLRKDLQARFGITRRRAELIARDQVATLNAQITEKRQTDVGVEEYIWSTSRDQRVRPEHAAREGVVFRWDNPPPDGHPGRPVNCRCTSEAVIPEAGLLVAPA